MDDMVKCAMLKWPNVPDVYGWLRLDCRGDWLLRMSPGQFDRIRNPGIVEFINRNYHRDERGCWFFQNGPQRAFVRLDCTPHVYRLDDACSGWLAHTGETAGAVSEVLFAEDDSIILAAALGPGVVADRDLEYLLDHVKEGGALQDAEAFVESVRAGTERDVEIPGGRVRVSKVRRADLAALYHFVPEPMASTTDPGEGSGQDPTIGESK